MEWVHLYEMYRIRKSIKIKKKLAAPKLEEKNNEKSILVDIWFLFYSDKDLLSLNRGPLKLLY